MEDNNNNFGITEEAASIKRGEIITKVKNFFIQITPAVVKVLSNIIYYTVRFTKAFVSSIFRMVMGKEI